LIVLKDSSLITAGLCPEMHYALGVASALKHRLFGLDTVVTALLDGTHNPGSLHPLGKAADLRTRDLTPGDAVSWMWAIKAELEPMGFDVVPEGAGDTLATTAAHIHIEFQLKPGEEFWHVLP
jgi:hypothetical protein